jgi:hypothetical protein
MYFYLTFVPQNEVTSIAAEHKKRLEGTSAKVEDILATLSLLPPVSLKKRKNQNQQDSQESGSKKDRGSTPKKSVRTSVVEDTSEADKNVVEDAIVIVDDPASAKKVLENVSETSSKRTTRAFGSVADVPKVPKKRTSVTKRRRMLKLSAEEQEELDKEEAIKIVEELKEKEDAEEALLVDSWESTEKVAPNPFLDDPLSKDELVTKLANQGIYKKVNFDEIPNYVINGPKHAINIPYTVPVQNVFSKILSDVLPKTNCIEEVATSASDETPVVRFVPSPVVEPLIEVDQHASSDVVESSIPEQEKAKLQKLALD